MNLNEETRVSLWIGGGFLGLWTVLWVLMGDFSASFMWTVGLWIVLVFLLNMAVHFADIFRR